MFPTCPSSSIPHYSSIPFSIHHQSGRKRLKTSTKPKFIVKKTYPCGSNFNFGRNSSWVCFSNHFPAQQVCEISITHVDSSVNLDSSSDIEEKDCLFSSVSSGRLSNCDRNETKGGLFSSFSKSIAFTLFWIVIGMCPIRGHQPIAIAFPSVSNLVWRKKGKIVKEDQKLVSWKDHEYSKYTQRLLESVSGVQTVIEAVRTGKSDIVDLEAALKGVKLKREELQDEIMAGLYAELRELRTEKGELVEKADGFLEAVLNAKREQDKLLVKLKSDHKSGNIDEVMRERIDKLVEEMDSGEKEYNALQEKVGEIEDQMSRRETMALSIGVRELSFIEQECERLVKGFTQEFRRSTR